MSNDNDYTSNTDFDHLMSDMRSSYQAEHDDGFGDEFYEYVPATKRLISTRFIWFLFIAAMFVFAGFGYYSVDSLDLFEVQTMTSDANDTSSQIINPPPPTSTPLPTPHATLVPTPPISSN